MVYRTYSASNAPDAPPPSELTKQYFAGKCFETGVVRVLDMETLKDVELTPAQMAEMTMTVPISGLTATDHAFFVGLPNTSITVPHVSVTWNYKHYQGTMSDSSDDAVSGLVNQLKSLKSQLAPFNTACQDDPKPTPP